MNCIIESSILKEIIKIYTTDVTEVVVEANWILVNIIAKMGMQSISSNSIGFLLEAGIVEALSIKTKDETNDEEQHKIILNGIWQLLDFSEEIYDKVKDKMLSEKGNMMGYL